MTDDNVDLLSGVKADPAPDANEEGDGTNTGGEGDPGISGQTLSDLIKDEKLKTGETAKKFKDVDSVIKGYEELQSKLGARIEDLSGDDLKALNKKFDVPESIEGYDFEDVGDNETIAAIRKTIHEAGISKSQAEGFDKKLRDSIDTDVKNQEYLDIVDLEKVKSVLEAEYGYAFKDKQNIVNEVLHEITEDDDHYKSLRNSLMKNPEAFKAMVKVGEIIGEDKLEFKSKTRDYNMDPSDIDSKIQKMIQDNKGTAAIMASPDLKKTFAHLHKLKAQYTNLQG